MILFDLICSDGHRFEAWFRSGDAFDEQQHERAIACPICSDRGIGKAPMAPRLARRATASGSEATTNEPSEPAIGAAAMREVLGRLRRHVEETCSYVGPAFPEEARRMHYGESETRDIYGEASPDQAQALQEEGIEVRSIPWMTRRDG